MALSSGANGRVTGVPASVVDQNDLDALEAGLQGFDDDIHQRTDRVLAVIHRNQYA